MPLVMKTSRITLWRDERRRAWELFLREVTEAGFHAIEHVPRAAHSLAWMTDFRARASAQLESRRNPRAGGHAHSRDRRDRRRRHRPQTPQRPRHARQHIVSDPERGGPAPPASHQKDNKFATREHLRSQRA